MIIISKDSMILEFFEDGEKKTIDIDHDVNSITKYMDHIVHIDDNVTVKDLFMHMSHDPDLIDAVFDSSLGGYEFEEFLNEAMEEEKPDKLLSYAVFEHRCNMDSDELLHDVRFTVLGIHPMEGILVPYSVELSPIFTYSNLCIKINTQFTVTKVETVNDEEIEMVLFQTNKPMTLYEVISALLFEVSYYGTPEMRKEIYNNMKAQVLTKMAEEDEELAGEIMANLAADDLIELESELKKSISDEDYETSAALRDKINNLKQKLSNNK